AFDATPVIPPLEYRAVQFDYVKPSTGSAMSSNACSAVTKDWRRIATRFAGKITCFHERCRTRRSRHLVAVITPDPSADLEHPAVDVPHHPLLLSAGPKPEAATFLNRVALPSS